MAQLKIAYQGERGANSHIACKDVYPDHEPVACRTFEDVIAMVEQGEAHLAMIPVENTIAGRVGDIHHLLPATSLHMIGEHLMRIRFQLMGLKGSKIDQIERAYSHVMALGQCRNFLRKHNIQARTAADTAGAARQVAERGDPAAAALAPTLAAEEYDLEILANDVEDAAHNTTRFVIMAPEPIDIGPEDGPCMTAFLFQVRNIPSSLYKALGADLTAADSEAVSHMAGVIDGVMLATAKIGAVHSVVYGGFSVEALGERIEDSESRVLITSDGGFLRGKIVPLKEIADEALLVDRRNPQDCSRQRGPDEGHDRGQR